MVVFLFAGSAIICGADVKCRNHIPTVANMLNSTIATPFLVTGFNAALAAHFVTVTGIAYVAKHKAPYWAMLQVTSAFLVYGSTVATLFVLPFTGWPNDWANIFILVSLAFWMMLAQIALRRGLRDALTWQFSSMTILYSLTIIPYIVVRALPHLAIPKKDIGLLVCQVVGATSLVLFILVCITHVWKVRVRLYHPEGKWD